MIQEFSDWCKKEDIEFKNRNQKRGGLKVFSALYPQTKKKVSDDKVKVAGVLEELEGVKDALHSDK